MAAFLSNNRDVLGFSVARNPSLALETALSLIALGRPPTRAHAAWATSAAESFQALADDSAQADLRSWRRQADAATVDELMTTLDGQAGSPALQLYQRVALQSRWPRFQAALDVERALHARFLLNGGPHHLLHGIGRGLAWNGSELRAGSAVVSEAHLRRAGLTLMPSVFSGQAFPRYDDRHVLVVHPMTEAAQAIALAGDRPARSPSPLGDLLGQTRANILGALHEAHTTTEVARRWHISAATASRHLTILREAGLVASQRQANEVHHTLSGLGRAITDHR